MTDFADQASERQEQLEAEALAMRKPEGPRATGYCLECGEELLHQWRGEEDGGARSDLVLHVRVDLTRRWCNAECRDMWEKRNR